LRGTYPAACPAAGRPLGRGKARVVEW
jgi:hypothetical protein